MIKINNIKLLTLLLLLLASCRNSSPEDGLHEIEIYSTNDLHGRFFDSLYNDNNVNPYSLAKVSTYIKERRALNGSENIVLLDIGDNLQGDNSVFYYNFIDTNSGHILSKVFNYIGYDAVIVGNHDIEAGHPVYDKLKKELNAPYLAANAIDVKTGEPYFEPYTILNKGGIKIAVIGMTNPNIPKWLSPDLWSGLRFGEMINTIDSLVQRVINHEGADVVIAALHGGLGDENEYSVENPSRYIAKNIKGLDFVFAAHDHKTTAELILNGSDSVWVIEGGSRASNLSFGRVKVVVKNSKIVDKFKIARLVEMKDVVSDNEYVSEFNREFNEVKKFTNQFTGILNNRITTRDAYFGPSEYIDMIHSIQLNASGADVSFAAPLSLDVTVEKGDLTYQDLMSIYPYENQLYMIEMSGEEIKNYLEYSYSKWINKMVKKTDNLLLINDKGAGERSRFKNIFFNFDSGAGIVYEVDATKDYGQKITIKSMADGSPFVPEKRYKVALSSYRASGGGDILEKGAGIQSDQLEKRVIGRFSDIREIIYNYLKTNGSITAVKLNHWKIVPEEFVNEAAKKDYRLLFGE
ncbi:MAG: bifunctional UDP-sugar hydrolase/5'-nucleotidase [Bacteroidales bacterium]